MWHDAFSLKKAHNTVLEYALHTNIESYKLYNLDGYLQYSQCSNICVVV